jgi:nucleoid-associated protein YgaU
MTDASSIVGATPDPNDPVAMTQTAILDAQALITQLQADISNPIFSSSQQSASRQALSFAQSALIQLQLLSTVTAAPTTYTVSQGDTLFIIAQIMLGDALLYKTIQNANHLRGLALSEGQVLVIPATV